MEYKRELHTIETKVLLKKDLEIHDKEVEKYTNDGWLETHTIIGYEDGRPMKRTVLEKYYPLPHLSLQAECTPIDDDCDIKDKIKELIHRYKYNVFTSTVSLYEEFMKDLEKLIK